MASTPKCFFRGVLKAEANGDTVTVPDKKRWIITNVIAANKSFNPAAVLLSIDGIVLLSFLPVATSDTITVECTQVVEAGSVLKFAAFLNNTAVMHVSGVEQDVYE